MNNNIIAMWYSQIFIENIEVITAGAISVLFAFLLWSIKESYKGHGAEMMALKKVEIILAISLGGNSINKSFFDDWKPETHEILLSDGAKAGYCSIEHFPNYIFAHELVLSSEFQDKGIVSKYLQ